MFFAVIFIEQGDGKSPAQLQGSSPAEFSSSDEFSSVATILSR